MDARDLFGRNKRSLKLAYIILAVTSILLGSAYYKANNAYIVHQGVIGDGFKSRLSDESRSTENKLSPANGSTLVSKRNQSFIESVKGNYAVKEEKRKFTENYNKHLLEDFANTDILDVYSDSHSDYRNEVNYKNLKNTDNETSADRSSLPFIGNRIVTQGNESYITAFSNIDQKIENEATTTSTWQVTKNGIALNQEAPRSHGRLGGNDSDVRTGGKSSDYFKINLGGQLGSTDLKIKYFLDTNMTSAKKKRVHKKFPRIKYDISVGSDSSYAVQDLGSLRINETDGSTFVLLVTYARSGSSWLGAMANQAEESFYVFEPFQKFIYQGYYKENLVCYNNNTCREPKSFLETHKYAITALHRLFTCQLTEMHPKALNILIQNAKSGNIKKCILTFLSVKKCLQELEKVCMATTHRVIKTIRISMELASQMMDLWPNLKVLHLVRDPRGITNSRLKNKTFQMTKKITPHSHNLCERMYNDTMYNTLLEKKYENRITLVIYEALAERPLEGMEFIYGFLNIKITKDVITWVYNSTHAQNKTGYFGTMRSDATESAYYWKTKLTLSKIRIIDQICHDVYKLLGFLPINIRTESEKSSFLSRQSIQHANWFT